MKKTIKKKSVVKVSNKGIANIKVTYNNTIVSIANLVGQIITWGSCGSVGFKGTKKSTPYATKRASQVCAENAYKQGMREIEVRIKGRGMNKEAAIKPLMEAGLRITSIKDCTGEPHNGCRPPKKRNL